MNQWSYLADLGMYGILYAMIGWIVEVNYYAIVRRKFCNRGFFTLPLKVTSGITFVLLLVGMPTLDNNLLLGYPAVVVIVSVVESLTGYMKKRIAPKLLLQSEEDRIFSGTKKGIIVSLIIGALYYAVYLVIHPWMMVLVSWIPSIVKKIITGIVASLLLVDFIVVLYAVRTGDYTSYQKRQKKSNNSKIASWISDTIWKRLQKSYPGIRKLERETKEKYIFAKGICLEKIIWVFLVSAFLGDLIETVYCGLRGDWMYRSSVLYGPFSFVWGIGAVVLTITLQKFARKNDRYVFVAGFFIGGVYEYMCSVFTEVVFGTVFWDYSQMPFNIGGRTNLLYCFFWGVFSVIWVKILYPNISKQIEKIHPIAGTILTWVVVLFMICNAALTSCAMLRYDSRDKEQKATNAFEQFLDEQYDDKYMEKRWPNMVKSE